MKTVLITGATGFLGGNLAKSMSREGYHLIALVRNKKRWDRFINGDGGYIEPIKGDINLPLLGLASRRFRRLAWQVDTVFHCAALTDFTQRDRLFLTNVEGTRHLLQFALLGRKKHFHHVSSAFIAGQFNGTFYEEDFNKNQTFNNSYEESKFNGEALVRRFAREHLLPFTIYRPSIIVGDSKTGRTQCYKGFYTLAKALFLIKERILKGYGCYPDRVPHAESALGITNLLQRAVSAGIPIRICGDAEAHINLVPVDYVAEAICELSKKPDAQGKTFHLVSPRHITLKQLADMVVKTLGIDGIKLCWGSAFAEEASASDRGQCLIAQAHGRLSPTERLFLHYTRPYIPYLYSRLSFDASNTINLLNGSVTCPEITHSSISMLIDRAIEDGWGERDNEQDLCTEVVINSV